MSPPNMYNTSSKTYLPLNYNLHQKISYMLISPYHYALPLFVTYCQRAIKIHPRVELVKKAPLALAKSACKTATSLSKSNKSCPWATWTMRHVSKIVCIDEEDDVDREGSTAAIGSTKSSAIRSPEGGALDASPIEDSTQGHLELAFNWAAFCLRSVAPIRAMIWIGSNAGKFSKPKSNKILWMKTEKNKPCDLALLLWTSTRERMKRVGKLIGTSVMRAYKNSHLSMGMVYMWEIGQMLW